MCQNIKKVLWKVDEDTCKHTSLKHKCTSKCKRDCSPKKHAVYDFCGTQKQIFRKTCFCPYSESQRGVMLFRTPTFFNILE